MKTQNKLVDGGADAGADDGSNHAPGVRGQAPSNEDIQTEKDGASEKRSANEGGKAPAAANLWQDVESAFRVLSLIAIAISAMVSALNFYQGYLDKKKERSVALMSAWQSSGERDTYARLGEALIPVIRSAGPIPSNLPQQARHLARRQIGVKLIEELEAGDKAVFEEVASQIDKIFLFFSEVEFCLRANLCDENLLKEYFKADVIVFWDYFQAYATGKRAGLYPTYGEAVETLAINFAEQ